MAERTIIQIDRDKGKPIGIVYLNPEGEVNVDIWVKLEQKKEEWPITRNITIE